MVNYSLSSRIISITHRLEGQCFLFFSSQLSRNLCFLDSEAFQSM